MEAICIIIQKLVEPGDIGLARKPLRCPDALPADVQEWGEPGAKVLG